MQYGKVISLIVGLSVLGVAVFSLLQLGRHPMTEGLRAGFSDKLGAFLGNLKQGFSPERRPPLSTIELEENLKLNLGVPFATFSREDWQWFWHLFYGSFPDNADRSWPRRKRQLDRQEIEDILADNYSQPFGYFREKQWGIFWQYLLKGKVFK